MIMSQKLTCSIQFHNSFWDCKSWWTCSHRNHKNPLNFSTQSFGAYPDILEFLHRSIAWKFRCNLPKHRMKFYAILADIRVLTFLWNRHSFLQICNTKDHMHVLSRMTNADIFPKGNKPKKYYFIEYSWKNPWNFVYILKYAEQKKTKSNFSGKI